jgi:hypothetical protein
VRATPYGGNVGDVLVGTASWTDESLLEAVAMPSGSALTRDQLHQAVEAGRPSVEELRGALRTMVKAASSLQAASFTVERQARQVMDELDQTLVGAARQENAR